MTGILTGPEATVGAVFRRFGGQYLRLHGIELSPHQQRILQELALCRTEPLGYVRWQCGECGLVRDIYNPCRSRHCPQCQGHLSRTWANAKQKDLLDLTYFHAVLTVPHEINVLLDVAQNHRPIYDLLFLATRDAITQVARNQSPLRATPGMLVVLHTWNQVLERHLHLHIAVPSGGWSLDDPDRFVTTDDPKWLAEEALMRAFRQAVMDGLERARASDQLAFHGRAAALADATEYARQIDHLRNRHWVVFARPSPLSPARTLDYLAHYTNKTGISNRRITAIDLEQGTVTFTYRNSRSRKNQWGEIEPTALSAIEFIDRFLLHVLPIQMSRCRTYGFWASRTKARDLPRIREQLGQTGPPESEDCSDDHDQDQDNEVDNEHEHEHEEHDQDNEDNEDEHEHEEHEHDEHEHEVAPVDDYRRRTCPTCKRQSMVKLSEVPKPTVYKMMQLKIWPEQYGYRRQDAAESIRRQTLLKDVTPYLPGGTEFAKGVAARLEQLQSLEYS